MDALAIIEITRDEEGNIVDLAAVDPSTIKGTHVMGRPGTDDLFQYVQMVDDEVVQVFEAQDLLIIPKKFSKEA